MNQGWIKLHRSLLDWRWYHDLPVRTLFIHFLLKANFTDVQKGELTFKRGQLYTGVNVLANDTGLSQQQIRTAIKKLKKTNEIIVEATNKFSSITIVNYEEYQQKDLEQQTNNKQITNEQQTNNEQSTFNQLHNKNDKKEDKEKNVDSTASGALKTDVINRKDVALKANKTKEFNKEFSSFWDNVLEQYPHNKNFGSANKRYTSLRHKGYTKGEIYNFYKVNCIDKSEDEAFVTQFVKVASEANLKQFVKSKSYKTELPEEREARIAAEEEAALTKYRQKQGESKQ